MKIRKRITGKGGFTLAETLMAVLILLMVSSVVAADAYRKVVDSANAELLLSTTMNRLRSELTTAVDVRCGETDKSEATAGNDENSTQTKNTTITYTNAKGSKSVISLVLKSDASNVEPGIYIQEYVDVDNNNKYKHLLVSNEASNKNLYATYESATYDGSGIVTIKNLAVIKEDNTTLTSVDNFEIRVISADLQN